MKIWLQCGITPLCVVDNIVNTAKYYDILSDFLL